MKLGIQKKVILGSIAAIIIFAGAIGYTLQNSANKLIKEEYMMRGSVLTRNLAYNSKVGLIFQDKENLSELIKGVTSEPGVEMAIILDVEKNRVVDAGDDTKFRESKLANLETDLENPFTDSFRNGRIDFILPVTSDNDLVGYIALGLSTELLDKKLASANKYALLVSVVFTALGVVVIAFVSRAKIKQLESIKHFAESLASGNHGQTVHMSANDEIGELADSLNQMSEKIAEAIQKAEESNNEAQASAKSLSQTHEKAVQEKKLLENAAFEMQKTFDRIKNGDLSKGVSIKTDGDLDRVGEGLNNMLIEFSGVLEQIRELSHTLKSTSSTVNNVSENITTGAESQYQQTESIAMSIDAMANNLEQSRIGIENARGVADKARQTANDGGSVVHQAIEGINRIASIVDDSTVAVQSLGDQSKQINDIIQVIEEIADQTNLLALNAAIEAARAGEQGRGFAVVADEVRKLAERTSHATGEIAGLIKKVLELTSDAVSAMQKGNNEMQEGKALVQNVGSALEEIVEAVQSIQQEFENLVQKSQEQSESGGQISDEIGMIREIAKQNKEFVAEVQAAGTGLSSQIGNLVGLVNRFKTAQQQHVFSQPKKSTLTANDRRASKPGKGVQHTNEGRRKEDKSDIKVDNEGNFDVFF